MQPTAIMARLKAETRHHHANIETLPFFEALGARALPLDAYIRQLRALAMLHGAFEKAIGDVADAQVSAVWRDDLRKLDLLLLDIRHFAASSIWDAAPVVDAALALAAKIRLRAADQPVSLLGTLYVLEGSTLGNSVHARDILASYQLAGIDGLRYYTSYGDRAGSRWQRFSAEMDGALGDPTRHDAVVAAAHETFVGLHALHAALHPSDGQRMILHVSRINPEAGDHPIPQSEAEIAAALRASDCAWGGFGYFAERYGTRGKRFSDSDACWLATLAGLDQEIVRQQVDWHARVLTTRGIPWITLEHTLFCLYDCLTEGLPEQARRYEGLRSAAEWLRAARTKVIPGRQCHSLADRFDLGVGPELAQRYRNTGRLLISAVADEANGHAGAASAVLEWLTDSVRFPGRWIAAVHRLVDEARRIAAE